MKSAGSVLYLNSSLIHLQIIIVILRLDYLAIVQLTNTTKARN